MTQIEAACFPDMVSPLSSQKMFLNLRNRILQMWLENPKAQLTAQDGLKRLQPPWNSDEDLVIRIHAFLEIISLVVCILLKYWQLLSYLVML